MRNNTKCFINFLTYIEDMESISLTECPCVNSGYKVFPSGELLFHNDVISEYADTFYEAWMLALDIQEL